MNSSPEHIDLIQFHATFDLKSVWKSPHTIDPQVLDFREELINEECVRETLPAFKKFRAAPTLENLTDLADGLVDSVYVLLGAVVALELPWVELWNEVQRSNMSKVWPDGMVHKREDGKVLKSPDFTPPDLFSILVRWQTDRMATTIQPIKAETPITYEEQQRLIRQWQSSGVNPVIPPDTSGVEPGPGRD